MSATLTTTRTGVRRPSGAPGAPGNPGGASAGPAPNPPQNSGIDYSKRPNAPPKSLEAVPSAEWARWRLYKQRPDIKDNFPDYFPDVRRQLFDRLNAEKNAAEGQIPDPPRFRQRSLDELRGNYQPTQLGFAPLSVFYDEADRQNARLSRRQRLDSDGEGDTIPSLWFERMAQDLFARVWEFCSDTFGLHSIADSHKQYDWTLQWLDKLPREFVVLASQVARGDRTIVEDPKASDPNNWEYLFLNDESRVKLLVGVIAKLLEKNVFNSLMFGAADVEKTALTADDHARAFLDNSYQRNRTRSETVRNYIQANRAPFGRGLNDLFTDNFWVEVDSVTMGILDLLLPLINLLGQDMPNVPWPPLRQVHQGLHDIVAEAAWFTNGMRASRSVFWIQFPLPGELNDISHEHAIDDIWNKSKAAAKVVDGKAKAAWAAKRDAHIFRSAPAGRPITEAQRTAYEAENPRPSIRRTAKVQVAMWPFIKRFTTVRERDAGDGAYNAGEIITQIMKAQCVYYCGDDADEADMLERRTLSEQIKSRRWAKWFNIRRLLFVALTLALFLVFVSPGLQQELDNRPLAVNSSSSGQGFLKEKTTTTIVAVPIGTEILPETVLAAGSSGGKDKSSGSWFKYKAPSVSKETMTVTETVVKKVNRESEGGNDDDDDDDDDLHSDIDVESESSDDDSDDSIAAKIGSAKDKATARIAAGIGKAAEGIASGKNKIASEFSSTTQRVAASISLEKEKVASIENSVRESVSKSLADETSSSSAASHTADDESSKSRAASRSSKKASRAASRSFTDSINDASASTSREIKSFEKSVKAESASTRSGSKRQSRIVKTSATEEAKAEAESSAEAETNAEAERIAASESSIISETIAAALAAEAEKARRSAASIAAEEEEKASSSSSASEELARDRTTAFGDDGIDTTTVVASVRDPVSVVDVTSSNVAVPEEKEKETVTITVPADKVVVTVTGPATQAETDGEVKKAAAQVNMLAGYWRPITKWFYSSWSFWSFLRFMGTWVIFPHPLLTLFILILGLVAGKQLLEDGLGNQRQWIGNRAA